MAKISRNNNKEIKREEEMNLEARPIIKNKFWIVEQEGKKIATIQAAPDGVVLVHNTGREKFVNFKMLSAKYNIKLGKPVKKPQISENGFDIYDYPTICKPHNEVFHVAQRLPFFTKSSKSKSFYCAGYYAIEINNTWVVQFCPKKITVKRYKYQGPFKNQQDANGKIAELNSGIIR